MNRATIPLTALILLLSFPTTATAQFRTTAEVVSIGDGDTLTVKEKKDVFDQAVAEFREAQAVP